MAKSPGFHPGISRVQIPVGVFLKQVNGVGKLIVGSTEIIQTIFGSIKELAGIDDEELWLG